MARYDQKTKRTTRSAKRRLEFGDDHERDEEQKEKSRSTTATVISSCDNEKFVKKGPPSFVLATPEKKRRRGDDESDVNGVHKQGISTYFSPLKTTATDARKASALVTPEKKEGSETGNETKEEIRVQQHVPIYIHKNLNYQRRGQAILNEKLRRTFDLVEEHYVIPSDFESNRSYGPLSGTCFEERVVDAYGKGLLSPNKPSNTGGIQICAYCAKLGHRQDDCPDLI